MRLASDSAFAFFDDLLDTVVLLPLDLVAGLVDQMRCLLDVEMLVKPRVLELVVSLTIRWAVSLENMSSLGREGLSSD
jgi:hypothetical protein